MTNLTAAELNTQAYEVRLAYGLHSDEYKFFCITNGIEWYSHEEGYMTEEQEQEVINRMATEAIEELKEAECYITSQGFHYHRTNFKDWYRPENQARWGIVEKARNHSPKLINWLIQDWAYWSKWEQRYSDYQAIEEYSL